MNPSRESGQSMAEYAFILSLVVVVAAAAFAVFGGSVDGLVQRAVDVIGSLA